ncbi:Acetyltransferase (GNAT) family protein [Micromonospora pallida]|uniref:Acetyltransferase (GNAT) family protein n=1 Tax=Micromonospora pallida TaxID=145854 RepID=A0A1C6T6P0_9ACTN|nr:GNAT family N-acetyltransferase [Micromonospora pallida]SCL37480.1 Acetyltransferase (GNAT) family protein [Micromonospora pallida]
MIEARPYAEADRAALRDLFARAGAGAPGSSLWGHAESAAAVYLDPYLDLAPGSLFVATDRGTLVGYLTGCLDSSTFPSEEERIGAAFRRYRLPLRPTTAPFLGRALADGILTALRRQPTAGDFTDRRWPSHLHINVAPEGRGTGAAAQLMSHWFDQLEQAGSPGCHLQTLVENTRAVRFFTRMGFAPYGPTPLVPGVRDGGRRLHQQTMVQSWDRTQVGGSNPSTHR